MEVSGSIATPGQDADSLGHGSTVVVCNYYRDPLQAKSRVIKFLNDSYFKL